MCVCACGVCTCVCASAPRNWRPDSQKGAPVNEWKVRANLVRNSRYARMHWMQHAMRHPSIPPSFRCLRDSWRRYSQMARRRLAKAIEPKDLVKARRSEVQTGARVYSFAPSEPCARRSRPCVGTSAEEAHAPKGWTGVVGCGRWISAVGDGFAEPGRRALASA